MKILVVSRGYPSENHKMLGIFEFDQAKALASLGHEVIFASIDVRSLRRWRKWGLESFKKDGIQVEAISLPGGKIPKNILNKISDYGFKKLYSKILKKHGVPDIIHAHFLGIGRIVTSLLSDSEIPLVLTEHLSSLNDKPVDPKLLEIGNDVYHHFDKVITVSNPLSKSLKENFNIDAFVIPNIVDADSFKYSNADNDSKNNKYFDFISTGALSKRKGMDVLITAFTSAFASNNAVRLFVYGEGPERQNLEKLIFDNNMGNKIFLEGLVDRKTIADQMKSSECFVLASKLETFGVVYIEAMAMGLPVIATKCQGPEDFVNDDNGILIPVNDPSSLEHALKSMYSNIANYSRAEISKETLRKFSPAAIAQQINSIYSSLS